MQLSEYTSLNEKKKYFQTGSVCVDTKAELYGIVPLLVDFANKKFVFRGVNEAKYKLYNSGQRKFIQQDLAGKFRSYKEFILFEIESFKRSNHNWINEYVRTGINENNNLALLSLMQHKGYPSPCIDFTSHPLTALYFAFRNLNSPNYESNLIDNYVSIYFMSPKDFIIPFINVGQYYREGLLLRNIYKQENHDLSLNNYKAFEAMFHYGTPMLHDITVDSDFAALNNRNILNQKGLLLLNPNGNTSIESTVEYIFRNYKGESWEPIKCLNLNKNLKEHVDQILELNNINEETMIPTD